MGKNQYRDQCPEELLLETPPDHVADLAEVAEAADCYEPAEGGGYRLTDRARQAIEEGNKSIRDLWQTFQEGLAERDATLVRQDQTIRRLFVERELDNALIEAGTPEKYRAGARAVLLEELTLEVEGLDAGELVAVAVTPFGRQSIAQAVNSWLATPAGEPFGPARPTVPGPYSTRLAAMKGGRLH